MAKKKVQKKINPNFIKWAWLCLVAGILFVCALFVLVSFTKMPDTEELENPDFEEASIIYADDLSELGKYFSKNRDLLIYEDLNPHLSNALVATEDERYFTHTGIDVRSAFRAILYLGTRGGASTITQQLAKQFFTKRSRSFVKRVWQKMKEWVIAVEFEKRYTKEEILAMYLNKFDFIYNSYGVSSASKTYFGKDQKKLSVDEAAVLIGMLKNPYIYNPQKFPENALNRRNVVLGQMVKNGYLREDELEILKEKPIDVSNFNRTFHFDGIAPHFKATLTSELKNLFSQNKYLKSDGTTYDIYEDGLKIYTTINKDMQRHAEAAAQEHMKQIQEKYFKRWKDKDPWTYRADQKQKDQRKAAFNRVVRESDRYLKMRNNMLSSIIQKILVEFPNARLLDSDINRMIEEEKKPGYLNSLRRKEIITTKQANVYKAILRSPLWSELKTQRTALDKKAMEAFNQLRKMQIFSYADNNEKTVNMTPLDSIRYHQQHMQIGSVSIDPSNGHVKTWVGGVGFKYFKYDHVKSNRQVGSTFKPFVYAAFIVESGTSPCHKVRDTQYEIPAGDPNFGLLETWSPSNSNGKFSEADMTLKDGLKTSTNSISVWIVKDMGSVKPIRNLVSNMGVKKEKIPDAPSIVLGASQLNVLEMTAAYSTFANSGTFNEPLYITRIEDKNGKVLYSSILRQQRVFDEKYNDVMVNFLKYASSNFTYQLNSEWGGKTGTTNDYVDGWFMGISPNLVVGTWVGGENNWIRFLNLSEGAGGVMARPFYLDYMKRLERDPKIELNLDERFKIPQGEILAFECEAYADEILSEDGNEKAKKVKVLNDQFDEEF